MAKINYVKEIVCNTMESMPDRFEEMREKITSLPHRFTKKEDPDEAPEAEVIEITRLLATHSPLHSDRRCPNNALAQGIIDVQSWARVPTC